MVRHCGRCDIHIGLLYANSSNGKSLKLASRQKINISIHDVIQLCETDQHFVPWFDLASPTKNIKNLRQIIHGSSTFDQSSNSLVGAFDCLWDSVDILRLDDSFKIILQDFREVVCNM